MNSRIFAVQYIRPMRGGTRAHLLRCSDGSDYVVKFQNNPQGARVLANDFLGTELARRLGLPAPVAAVIDVSEGLIKNSVEMTVNVGQNLVPCLPGPSFGSRYPNVEPSDDNPVPGHVFDFLPPTHLRRVKNLSDFIGILAFDKWTCNLDQRQAVFLRGPKDQSYSVIMIDHGCCFEGVNWDFHDAPSRGLYYPSIVYETVTGMNDFEPWLFRLEHEIDMTVLEQIAREIPLEWYECDSKALRRLLDRLDQRRSAVRDLLLATWKNSRRTFPNWIERRESEKLTRRPGADD